MDEYPQYLWGLAAQPVFDDTRRYFSEELPGVRVRAPGLGVRLRVRAQQGTSLSVRLGSTRRCRRPPCWPEHAARRATEPGSAPALPLG